MRPGGGHHRLFHSSRGQGLRALLLALAAIALMAVDHQYAAVANARSVLSLVVYPVEWLVNAPAAGWRAVSGELTSRQRLIDENGRLRRQLLLARARLERLGSLERENERLRALLNSAGTMPGHVTVAGILEVDLNPFENVVSLNIGGRNGVRRGQPVLDADGIVGQVVRVSPFTAQAMLITDPASAIPVEIERTGLATLAVGTGNLESLSLPYLPNNADVKPGDRLVTSGLGGRYPRGYPVGTVVSVAPQPGARFADVAAEPLARLGREHEVLVYFGGQTPPPKP